MHVTYHNMSNILISREAYTQEFYEELFNKIEINNRTHQKSFKDTIEDAADAYLTYSEHHAREIPINKVKTKLQQSLKHLNKASEGLENLFSSSTHSISLMNNLFDVIYKKHPPLHGLLDEIIPPNALYVEMTSPMRSLALLQAMAEGIEQTLDYLDDEDVHEEKFNKSEALYRWVMILSAMLEPTIGRKLEQSRYHEGEYISKRELNDSELLLFIIKPLDPNVTISQIETAIKQTRQERHAFLWNN